MSIGVGTKLGPYDIQCLAGSGGMGEVYRARDSRLDRTVAIKILPEAVAGDNDRLRRFEQEARAIAALNHPNILSIHDTGAYDGARYIVTELLEGDTLRERLAGGPLPVRKAVDYALQICRGLAAAHENGITHRDLKPENIYITRDGRVKILDFGLAKQEVAPAAAAATATLSARADTSPGTVVGTAGYMSPEQVRGRPVDPRTDIFAFGAVMYEMISGKRAFRGDTPADTMSAILKEEPPELTETNRNLPPGLERIVRHCLEKNPEERFQSAHDIAFALDALTGVSSSSGTAAKVDFGPRIRLRTAAAVVAAAAALALLAIVALRPSRSAPPQFRPVTFRLGWMGASRFTPDGDIVYSAAWDGGPQELYVARQGSPGDRALGIRDAEVLAISSTGEIAIRTGTSTFLGWARVGTLARVPLTGGAPRPVLDNVQYADYSPDGKEMAIVRYSPESARWRLEYPIGKNLYETSSWLSHPRISPDGSKIAFFDHPPPQGDDRGDVAVLGLDGKKRVLSTGWSSLQGIIWHGDELWFTGVRNGTSRELYAVTLGGKERPLLSAPSNLLLEDVNRKGDLLVKAEHIRLGVLALGPGATKERELAWFNWSIAQDITPDGKTVLLEEEGDAGGSNYLVYIRNTDGSPAVRLGEGSASRISPDGKWVLSQLPGSDQPLRLIPTGTGDARDITHSKLEHANPAWFPDGKRILFIGIEPAHGPRDYILDVETGKEQPLTPEGTRGTVLSPDGRFVVVTDAHREQHVWSLDNGSSQPIKGLDESERAFAWTADGKELYVTPIRGAGILPRTVSLLDPASGRRRPWRTIAPADLTGVGSASPPHISRDGRAYAYTYTRSLADLYVIQGVK